jgi:hypothetical protein
MYYLQQSNISNTFTKARENEDTEIALSLDGADLLPNHDEPTKPVLTSTVENGVKMELIMDNVGENTIPPASLPKPLSEKKEIITNAGIYQVS